MTRWPFGLHWAQRAYDQVRPLGASFVWLNADTIGDPAFADDIAAFAASGLDFILEIKFTSEARLRNLGGVWERDCVNVLGLLHERGLLARCLAVQLDDEFFSNFVMGAGHWNAQRWPSIPRGWRTWHALLGTVGALVEARIADLRRIWGADLPAAGIGMAETGSIAPPSHRGLDWWGINGYLGHGRPRPEDIHALYRDVRRHTSLPLMPVLGLYEDTTSQPLAPLPTLAAAYLPVLEAHAPRIWAVGLFCLHHPSVYQPQAHVQGRGLLELPDAYRDGVRWLTATYAG